MLLSNLLLFMTEDDFNKSNGIDEFYISPLGSNLLSEEHSEYKDEN
jgi:hypothetical protein